MKSSHLVRSIVEENAREVFALFGGEAVRALDLGSGSRAWSIILAQIGYDVSAIDRDPVALAQLQEKVKNDAPGVVERTKLIEADFLQKFPEGSFALILALDICHLLTESEQRELLSKISAHLSPAGRWIVLAKKCWMAEQERILGFEQLHSEETNLDGEHYFLKIFKKY